MWSVCSCAELLVSRDPYTIYPGSTRELHNLLLHWGEQPHTDEGCATKPERGQMELELRGLSGHEAEERRRQGKGNTVRDQGGSVK
jgi:hypothetical protein